MHYLVDTYNLVHSAIAMGGPLSDMTVRKLCQFISASAMKVTLILDGRPKPDEPSENEFPDINLIYSGTGIPADAIIADRVERAKSKKKLIVVSNDRAVALHARRHYAGAISCETFLKQLTGQIPRPTKETLSPNKLTGTPTTGESDHWLKEFGLDTPNPLTTPPPKPAPKTGNPEIDNLDIESLLGPPGDTP